MSKNKKVLIIMVASFILATGFIYCLNEGYNDKVPALSIKSSINETKNLLEISDEMSIINTVSETTIYENSKLKSQDTTKISSENPKIFIHIYGAIENPNVYKCEESIRLFELIDIAGGFTNDADRNYLNLSQVLFDGMKIFVPTIEEVEQNIVLKENLNTHEMGIQDSVSSELQTAKVNINTAALEELMTLSGIGESKAASIIKYRENVGSFRTIEEIMNISGIKAAAFEKIADSICVN